MRGNTPSGFTILEALIASALFFMAISIAVISFMAGSRHFSQGQETIDALHNCYNLVEMISGELREADPTTLNIAGNRVTFDKYHRPAGELQRVTWRYDNVKRNVERTYAVGGVPKGTPQVFGKNIMSLTFARVERDIPPAPSPLPPQRLKKVTISITVKGDVRVAPNVRRNIIDLSVDVFLRQEQKIQADLYFVGP